MNMTRRDFLGASATVLASTAIGSPIRSSIGGRMEYHEGDTRLYDSDVEYLESTGTQWIDTGYNPYNKKPIFTIDLFSIGNQSRVNMFGATYNSSTSPFFWLTCGGIAWAWGMGGGYGGGSSTSEYANRYMRFVYNVPMLTISVNGVFRAATVGKYSFTMPNKSLYLFDCNGFSDRRPFVGRIYGCSITENDDIVCEYQPVRFTNEYGETEGAMYDRVSGQLFRNQGTGSFIIGPDI